MSMSSSATLALLLVGLVAAHSAHSSAIKGHQQQQPVQRAEEPARKAPVQQQQQALERSPKSVPAQQVVPVLESSKKVYNDEAIRRSANLQQQQQVQVEQVPVVAGVKSPPAPVESPAVVVPAVVAVPAQVPAVPVPVASPVVSPVVAPVVAEQPVVRPVEPVVRISDELPQQSDRSVPIKEQERLPVAPVLAVPVAESVPVAQQQQQAPVVEPKPAIVPVVPEAQVQPVVPVVPVLAAAQVQPEPVKPALVIADSPLQAKKDEPAPSVVVKEEAPIEVPAPDPGLVLSEPIDSTTKLLIDLDEHVQKFLPAEDKQEPARPDKEHVLVGGVDYSPAAVQGAAGDSQPSGKSNVPLVPYSSSNVESEPIVPPLPSSLEKVEKASGAQAGAPSQPAGGQSASRQAGHQHQNNQQVITQLMDQLDSLQNRIQDTINQLVARRRYVMSALLRPMGTYVRRVRTNLERLQNRVNQLQAAASSVGGSQSGQNRPGGFVDAAAIETIRKRIDDISKRISDIVNRIRFSLTPTSAPLNSNGRK